MRGLLAKIGYVLANMLVMVILHGNRKQFWPKIPLLSLRDESVGEHVRLLFNTLSITSLLQVALGQLPRKRWLARLLTIGVIPASLPALILCGQRLLRLQGQSAEVYNLALVPLLPMATLLVEDVLTTQLNTGSDHADYAHLV